MAVYNAKFIGPIKPTDTRATSNFIGPTLQGGGATWQSPQPQTITQSYNNSNNNQQVIGLGDNNFDAEEKRQREELEAYNQMIERDYETSMSDLSGQENVLRSQAGSAEQGLTAGYGSAKTAIGEEQATKEAGITREEQLATTNKNTALTEARDLFRDTQIANNAQLSGLGISSSSVTEALAEKLGVETARRIAGVSNSTQEIMQNLSSERTRAQTFYKSKLTDLENTYTAQKSAVQSQLMAGIQQVNSARNQATSDKANRRSELLLNAQRSLAALKTQKDNITKSLELWNQQKTQTFSEVENFLIKATDFTAQKNWINKVGELPTVGGLQAVPTMESQNNGWMKPGYTYKKTDEEDPNNTGGTTGGGINWNTWKNGY